MADSGAKLFLGTVAAVITIVVFFTGIRSLPSLLERIQRTESSPQRVSSDESHPIPTLYKIVPQRKRSVRLGSPSFESDLPWIPEVHGSGSSRRIARSLSVRGVHPAEKDEIPAITDGESAWSLHADTFNRSTPNLVYQDGVDLSGARAIVFDWAALDEHVSGGGEVTILFSSTQIWKKSIWVPTGAPGHGTFSYYRDVKAELPELTGPGRFTIKASTSDDWFTFIIDNIRVIPRSDSK